jgi:hypothetical protein
MESCTNQVNVVIYGLSEDLARSTAELFGTKQSGVDIWEGKHNGTTVKTYIRWFGGVPTQTPKGVTDVLIVSCASCLETVCKYVDQRRGIPQKYLVSDFDLKEDAQNLKVDYLTMSDLKSNVGKIVDSALTLNETLRNVFSKIDLDGDGSLTYDEIIKASSELNHVLNDEDAKEIAKTLSSDGKINFDQFKQWWVMGRADLRAFRRLVALEMKVNHFLKSSSGITVTTMFEKLKKETEEAAAQETSLDNRVNVVPVTDFESGTAIRLHLNLGNSFDSLNENIGKSGTVGILSLEFKLKNPEVGKVVIETLTQLKEMAKSFIPDAESIIDKDAVVSFRQVGDSVFVDVSYEGENADSLCFFISMIGANSVNFSGQSDLHICSKVSPVDLLTTSFDNVIENGSNLRIEAHGEYSHLRNLVNFAQGIVESFGANCCSGGFNLCKPICGVAQLLCASRKIDFGLKYDSEALAKFILQTIKEAKQDGSQYEKARNRWAETQAKINGGVEGGRMMAGMFVTPFIPAITNINWDNISVSFRSQLLRAHVKLSLGIRGLTDFVSTFLN